MLSVAQNTSAISAVHNRFPITPPHTQSERKRTIPKAEIKHSGFFALGALLLFVAMAVPALAQAPVHAVWDESPGSGDWNTGANWTSGTAAVGVADTATFNFSNTTSLFLSGDVTIF